MDPAERPLAEDILARVRDGGGAAVDAVALPLEQVAALLARCRCYIGNDTGVLNMAAALRVAIGLFGGSAPLWHSALFIRSLPPAGEHGMAAITVLKFWKRSRAGVPGCPSHAGMMPCGRLFFRQGWLLLAVLPLTQIGGRALFNLVAGLYVVWGLLSLWGRRDRLDRSTILLYLALLGVALAGVPGSVDPVGGLRVWIQFAAQTSTLLLVQAAPAGISREHRSPIGRHGAVRRNRSG